MSSIITGAGPTKIVVSKIRGNYLVELCSKMRPGLKSNGWVSGKDDNLHLKVAVLAGALAERQNTMFMDKHDPDACAKAAEQAYYETRLKAEKDGTPLEAADTEIFLPDIVRNNM